MKAYELQSFGIENLKQVDRPDVEPGPGEVLVAIKSTSLNYRDYLTVIGEYNPRQKMPLIPLCDGAGEVIAVGAGVKRLKVGDRVASNFAQDWVSGQPNISQLRTSLGGPLDGCLVEQRIFPEYAPVKLPDYLSYEEASTLPCAAVTAWSAMMQAGTKAGDTVLVLGTGGVSIFALQFAKMQGAQVIVTSSSDEKIARAKGLGADHSINYRTKPNWSKEVRRITRMAGADHVIEVGGTGTLEHSIMSTKLFGHISLIGVLAGGGAAPVNMTPVLMQNIRVQGILVGGRDSFEEMLRAMQQHTMQPVIDRVFDFNDAPAAFEYLAAGKHFGKVCIRVAD